MQRVPQELVMQNERKKLMLRGKILTSRSAISHHKSIVKQSRDQLNTMKKGK